MRLKIISHLYNGINDIPLFLMIIRFGNFNTVVVHSLPLRVFLLEQEGPEHIHQQNTVGPNENACLRIRPMKIFPTHLHYDSHLMGEIQE